MELRSGQRLGDMAAQRQDPQSPPDGKDESAPVHAPVIQAPPTPALAPKEQVQQLLIYFLEKNCSQYNPRYAVNPVKQWLVYLKVYYPQAGALFADVKRVKDPGEMAAALGGNHWVRAA